MRQLWICCKQTLRASSGLFVWLGACAVVSLLPGAWDSAPTTARSLVLIAFVGLTAFAYRIAVHFPDRVDARNELLRGGSCWIGSRYVTVPADLCSNRGHPRGRFHPRLQPSIRRPVAWTQSMLRLFRHGCSCPVAPRGPAEWVVTGSVNWADPPRRVELAPPSDRHEARANWVLLADFRGFHDVRVEKLDARNERLEGGS